MRPGWNPTRRNRHAGTKANGHGRQNNFGIPFGRSIAPGTVVVRRAAGESELAFVVEPARRGCVYPCTIDDIAAVLAQFPPLVGIIVLRQPTRKEELHAPVWGRALWHFEGHGVQGPAISLDARSLTPFTWPRRLSPEYMRELQRLREDGHAIVDTGRGLRFHPTEESLRNTVLFRTVLHELGHHADYQQRSDDSYYLRTPSAREDFAHRFAAEAQARLVRFAPIIDTERMAAEGLRAEWFTSKLTGNSEVILSDDFRLE